MKTKGLKEGHALKMASFLMVGGWAGNHTAILVPFLKMINPVEMLLMGLNEASTEHS